MKPYYMQSLNLYFEHFAGYKSANPEFEILFETFPILVILDLFLFKLFPLHFGL